MSVNYKDLAAFAQRMNIAQSELDKLSESCVKELGARLLRSVTLKTPVGIYPKGSGKVGGTLRRGWTAKTHADAVAGKTESIQTHLSTSPLTHSGQGCTLTLSNPVEYASYVEHGHRTGKNGDKWVEGRHMLQKAEEELRPNAQAIVNRKVTKWMEGVINGK